MLLDDDNNETIDVQLVVSKCDIILAVLKFSLVYCLSQTAVADLFKMLNCFFGSKIFPSSRYLVDQFSNSRTGMEYHATCPKCKQYVGKFERKDRRITYDACQYDIELKNPTYNEYFAMINVKHEIAQLREDNHEY